jgi:CIC family chloride channel protein
MIGLEQLFKRRVHNTWAKFLVGGITLGLLLFLFPPLYGEGYDVIKQLINGDSISALADSPFEALGTSSWVLVGYFAAIVFFKIFASVATNGGGGVGGIFAPSLFMGAIVGFICARLMNMIGLGVPEANFALAGMSGLMAGVMHAPLTGIFLIAELTGGYHLFMPLMAVAVVSFLTIKIFEPHSLYAMRLAQKGELLTHNKDRSVLTLMKMENVLPVLHDAAVKGYAIYTLVWTDKEVVTYVNDQEVARAKNTWSTQDMYLYLRSYLPEKQKPGKAAMNVDWIRVYTK